MARKKTEFEVGGIVTQPQEDMAAASVTQPQGEYVSGDVPEYVDAILKVYSDQAELYIDKCGSAYASNTPEHMRPGAILYRNKYFTK